MKIGVSSFDFELTEKNFRKMVENKIEAVEVSMHPDKYKDINYKELSELSRAYNVMLWSYHLPFSPASEVDPSALDADIRKNTKEYFSELIKKGSNIGIKRFVIHPSSEPIDVGVRDEKRKYSMQSLEFFAELADKEGAVICVEDLPRTCLGNTADDILRLISANDKLKVCFDTNHLTEDDNFNFIEKVGKKFATLHVSDYDRINERHWLPGEGVTDWNELYGALLKSGYDGVWMYEITLKRPKTIIRDRDLTFADFYKNANEIFSGKDLTVFSKPKENLGYWE